MCTDLLKCAWSVYSKFTGRATGNTVVHLPSLTRGVELGGSERQETIVDEWLCQVVLQVLQRALARHNGLQQHQLDLVRFDKLPKKVLHTEAG